MSAGSKFNRVVRRMDPIFAQVMLDYRANNYQRTQNTCELILRESPDNVEALFILGLCHCRTGNANIGIRAIKRAFSLKPELADYDFLRGLMVQQKISNQADLWETCFSQYLQFQMVDSFLISYPKCGRTWLRMLLGKYVIGPDGEGDPLEVLQATQEKPKFSPIEVSHDDYPHRKPADAIFTNKNAYAGKKVIFLLRDPRDVMVSYFFQYTRRGDKEQANDSGFNGDLSIFIRHRIGGLENLVNFYNVWAGNRHVPAGFLTVKYEDMVDDVGGVFSRVVDFLGWPTRDENFVSSVIDYCSFDNMRKLEESNVLDNSRLSPPKDGDPEGFNTNQR